MIRFVLIICLGGTTLLSGCSGEQVPLETVDEVDLERYAGLFYEISSIPSIASNFGRCTNTTAEYTVQDDGKVRLFNQCFQDSFDGPELTISGIARPVDESNAKLLVRFDGFIFEAPYWIIDLDEEGYRWAVVGEPSRNSLFILSRTPQIEEDVYEQILSRLPEKGYDPRRLKRTAQSAEQ